MTQEASVSDFFISTTKSWRITVSIDDAVQDISLDAITMFIKTDRDDTDANAVLSVAGDCATEGADGVCIFTLTPAQTTIDPGEYFIDFKWITSAAAEYILPLKDNIRALSRVSD